MVGEGLSKLLLLLVVFNLDEGLDPQNVVPVCAVGPAPRQLRPRRGQRHRRQVRRGLRERAPVDPALPPEGLAEQIRRRVAFRLGLRQVQVEEHLLTKPRIQDDAREVVPAKQELVRAACDPEEVHLLGRVQAQAASAGRVAERRHDVRHERQEGRDADARPDGDEDLATQSGRHRGGVGPVERDRREPRTELLLKIQALLRQLHGPIPDSRDNEVNGLVLLA
mmetsp:Transcript_104390/g.319652  ORF Transcript_104390/g.319652 Transcript_104390/m.319652 type:complete len:223 (+) Transcript_104390:546-1214(+)